MRSKSGSGTAQDGFDSSTFRTDDDKDPAATAASPRVAQARPEVKFLAPQASFGAPPSRSPGPSSARPSATSLVQKRTAGAPADAGKAIQRVIDLNLGAVSQEDSEIDGMGDAEAIRSDIARLSRSGKDAEAATLCIKLGKEYMRTVNYEEAVDMFSSAQRIRAALFGNSHPETAAAEVCIAEALERKGEYFKAIKYLSRALGTYEQNKGGAHPDAFSTAMKIAAIQSHQVDYYDRALDCYEKSLAIKMEMLGLDHPSTAMTISNMAAVYKNKGDLTRALEHYTRALTIRRKTLGDRHQDTATAISNVADMYRIDGDLNKALQYLLWALDIRKDVLGERNRITVDTLYNIAIIYKKAGMFTESARFFEQSAAALSAMLGGSHPEVIEAQRQTLRAQAQAKKAK